MTVAKWIKTKSEKIDPDKVSLQPFVCFGNAVWKAEILSRASKESDLNKHVFGRE